MASAGSLTVSIAASTAQLQSGLNQASNMVLNFNNRLGSMLKNGALLSLGADIYNGVKLGAEQATKTGLSYNNMLQQNTKAFETMLGSSQQAATMMEDIQEMAAFTPFETEGLTSNVKLMKAYGFETNKTLGLLTTIGDAASALSAGDEGINRMTRALGQIRTKGKVMAQEMNQLSEIGIAGWQMLADAAGKSTAEMMKLSEDGAISADFAIKAILDGMNKRYAGAMAAQAKTYGGQLSTIKDYSKQMSGALTKPLFDMLSSNVFPSLISKSEEFKKVSETSGLKAAFKTMIPSGIVDNISSIFDATKGIVTGIVEFVSDNGDTITGVITNVTGTVSGLINFVNDHGAITVGIIGGIATAFIAFNGISAIVVGVTGAVTALRTALFALNANPIIAVATILGGLVGTLIGVGMAKSEAANKTYEFLTATKAEINETDRLIGRYEILKNKASATKIEKQELHDIEVKLAELYPTTATGIDEQNKRYTDQIGLVKELHKEKTAAYKDELQLAIAQTQNKVGDWEQQLTVISQKRQQLNKLMEQYKALAEDESKREIAVDAWESVKQQIKQLDEQEIKVRENLDKYWSSLKALENFEVSVDFSGAYIPESIKESYRTLAEQMEKIRKSSWDNIAYDKNKASNAVLPDYIVGNVPEGIKAKIEALRTGQKEMQKENITISDGADAYDKLTDKVKDFIDAIRSQAREFSNFVGIFEKATLDQPINMERWLNRLKGQLNALKTYQQSLATLKAKADQGVIGQNVYNELAALGPSAAKQLQVVAKASNSQLQQVNSLFGQKSNIASSLAYDRVNRDMAAQASVVQIVNNFNGGAKDEEIVKISDRLSDQIIKDLKRKGLDIK